MRGGDVTGGGQRVAIGGAVGIDEGEGGEEGREVDTGVAAFCVGGSGRFGGRDAVLDCLKSKKRWR